MKTPSKEELEEMESRDREYVYETRVGPLRFKLHEMEASFCPVCHRRSEVEWNDDDPEGGIFSCGWTGQCSVHGDYLTDAYTGEQRILL